jgi:ribosome maturation factor RimP
VIEPVVRAHGGEMVDVEWKQEPGGWVLRLFVEKLGSDEAMASTKDAAVSLDLCANVAKDLSPALDVADLIPHRYQLEVSSPGVERPLRGHKDYVRFQGQKAKVKLAEPVDGQKVLVGVIEASEKDITLRDGQKAWSTPLSNVVSGRLVFEFGPAPRPSKQPASKQGRAASFSAGRGPEDPRNSSARRPPR